MKLTLAISHRRLKALTLLISQAWHQALREAELTHKYPSIPEGIERGFSVGIPQIMCTYTLPNSNSLYENIDKFLAIVQHKQNCGRYLGPFSKSLLEHILGPFQTSPLLLIPKPHKPDTF